MPVNTGLVKDGFELSKFPPAAASYQRYVPPGAVAVNVAVLPEQILTVETVGAAGAALIVIVKVSDTGAQLPAEMVLVII